MYNGSPYAIGPLSVCPVYVTVYYSYTVGWIKMRLGMQLGIGPGHIVLDEGPSSPSPKGAQPPIFGRYLLWLNGWMD